MSSEYTVLFVDDEPQVLLALSLAYQKNFKVLTANTGAEALETLKLARVHVVVSDQRMPQMLGHELLQKAKVISPNSIRVLLTGYSDLDAVISSVNVGDVFRFVNKPWDNDRLRETIVLGCRISEKLFTVGAKQSYADEKSVTESGVLIADSNQNHQAAIKDLLASEFNVHLAASPNEAFETLKSRSISVIVSDSIFGELEGVEFLAAVKGLYPDIAPVLLSDSKDANLAIRLINEGRVFRYLVKPFKREFFKECIREAAKQYSSFKSQPERNVVRQENQFIMPPLPTQSAVKPMSLQDALKGIRERAVKRLGY